MCTIFDDWHSGTVSVNGQDDVDMSQRHRAVMYLPQEPYTTQGSLADQITYPLTAKACQITGLARAFHGVDLGGPTKVLTTLQIRISAISWSRLAWPIFLSVFRCLRGLSWALGKFCL